MVSSKGVEPKIKFTGYKVKKLTYGMKIELEKPDFQAKYALTTDKKVQRLKSVLISEESITKKGN